MYSVTSSTRWIIYLTRLRASKTGKLIGLNTVPHIHLLFLAEDEYRILNCHGVMGFIFKTLFNEARKLISPVAWDLLDYLGML